MKSWASFSSVDIHGSPRVAGNRTPGLWLLTILLLFGSAGLQAETPMNNEEAYSQWEQKLNLTDEQKPRVQAIFKENLENLKKIRSSDENRLSKARALKTNGDEMEKKLATVLNDQQLQTYRELRKEMRDKLQEHRDQNKVSE
ncbi:hypothetical protein [Endozoicomonas numazuensis]|uniref:Zinc resistance-associated protein n=1 Tax=Endozoicomonas numazuensis TaxID=1137799 RepID=A0A081NDJ9_9GAMM|nr:hypothetical protein [Endozoicomonas numazuensis]KEQ16522.1 hypothetical protein GZ78_21985 [Endozoicomonas numazuensis]